MPPTVSAPGKSCLTRVTLSAYVDVAHPGPVAAHDRVSEERDPHHLFPPVDEAPVVRLEPEVPRKLRSRERARPGVAMNQALVLASRLAHFEGVSVVEIGKVGFIDKVVARIYQQRGVANAALLEVSAHPHGLILLAVI